MLLTGAYVTTETADTTDLSDLQHANDDTRQSKRQLNTPHIMFVKNASRVGLKIDAFLRNASRKMKDESREEWTPFAGRLFNMQGA